MNNWKVIFATVVIFGTGVVTGGLLVNYVLHPHFKAAKRPAAAVSPASASNPTSLTTNASTVKSQRPPEILSKDFLQRLDTELKLVPAQHEAVQKIINEGQNLIRKTIQDARLEIREVLTPEQRDQFDDLVKRPFRRQLLNTNSPPASLSSTNLETK